VNIRSPDRESPGRAAGLVGTILVHAAVASFLFTTVKPSKAAPPSYAVDLVAAPAPTQKRLAREALPTPPPEEKPAPVKPPPPKPPPNPPRLPPARMPPSTRLPRSTPPRRYPPPKPPPPPNPPP
jgi:hypothetical protein